MAATYSSFMTTRFYSPVFNTALFDGAFRIYFSQSYESSALKIYYLLQTEYPDLWNQVKKWSSDSKEHIFLLIYPDINSIEAIFDSTDKYGTNHTIFAKDWEEGLAVGLCQPSEAVNMQNQLDNIRAYLSTWLEKQSLLNFHDVTSEKQAEKQ